MSKGEPITTKFKVDLTELKAGMQEASRTIRTANSEFKATSSSLDNWAKSTDGLNAKVKQLTTVLDAEKKKLEILKEQHSLVSKEQGENSKAAKDLEIRINNQQATVNKTEKSLNSYKKELSNVSNQAKYSKEDFEQLNKSLKDMAGDVATKAVKGIAAIGASLAGLAVASVKVGMDFDAAMSEVSAISGAVGEDFDLLREKAKEMGEKTKFSASEAAEAFKYMAMAGWKTEDMLGAIDGVMNLAAASGENLGTVSDIVTDAMTAFGLAADGTTKKLGSDGLVKEISNASYFSDVLAAASSNSNTNVAMMGETFKYVAPLAGSLKYNIEDTALATGLMANAGIKGSQAGTALRSILTRLVKPTEDSATAMEELGISLTDNDGNMKSLYDIMLDLRSGFADLTEEEKGSYAAMLGGQEALSGLLSIVNASDADFTKLKTAINNSNGAALEMSETMQDNLKGSAVIMGSSLEGAAIKVSDIFKGPLKNAVDDGTQSINKLSRELDKPATKKSLGQLADGVGNVASSLISTATKAIPSALKAFSFLIDKSGVLIPSFATLASAVALYKIKTDLAKNSTEGLNKATLLIKTAQMNWTKMVEAHNGVMDLAIIKEQILSKLQAAAPWGLLAVGIGLVATGIANTILNQEAYMTETEKLKERLDEQTEAWEDLSKAQEENLSSNLSEIDHIKSLKAELDTLVDGNGKVKEGYENRANFIVNELAEATGLEIEMIDGVIQNHEELSASIDQVIAKQRAKIILDSEQSKYEEALKNQTEAVSNLRKAHEEYTTAKSNYDKDYELLKKQLDETVETSERRLLEQKMNNLSTELVAKKTNYDEQVKLVGTYNEQIATYEEMAALVASGTAEDIEKVNSMRAKSYESAGENITLTLEEQIANEEELLEYWKNKYKETGEEMYLDQQNASKTRLEQLKTELDAQKSTVEEKTPPYLAVFQAMQNGAVQVLQNSEGFRSAGSSNIDALGEGANSKKSNIFDTAKSIGMKALSGADEGLSGAATLGGNFTAGLKSGALNGLQGLVNAGATLGNALFNAVKNNLDIHSPSKKGDWLGQMFDLGVGGGIKRKTQDVVTQAKQMSNALVKTVGEGVAEVNALYDGVSSQDATVMNGANATNPSVSPSKTINYNQYISSPQPLNRMEIRRQTKNTLKLIGGN